MLYIVATPIGNLKDITLRAVEVLKTCHFVIAENPGYSRRLLEHIDAWPKEIVQFAEHNEQRVLQELARKLATADGCLITDAGTPGISDPGFRLVRECLNADVKVQSVPGPSAALAALVASGLPTDRFLFLGFVPKTEIRLIKLMQQAQAIAATVIFFESPKRIQKTMGFIAKAFPFSQAVVARELTKLHEEWIRGTAKEVLDNLLARKTIKGEITVLLSFKNF